MNATRNDAVTILYDLCADMQSGEKLPPEGSIFQALYDALEAARNADSKGDMRYIMSICQDAITFLAVGSIAGNVVYTR